MKKLICNKTWQRIQEKGDNVKGRLAEENEVTSMKKLDYNRERNRTYNKNKPRSAIAKCWLNSVFYLCGNSLSLDRNPGL